MPNIERLVILAPAFTVAALAIADRHANAVGVVRLTCSEESLHIELIQVAAYRLGFAPSAIAAPIRFAVPYTAIRGLVRRGRTLHLALDPAACSPFNRFSLVRFSHDMDEALISAYRSRFWIRLVSYALPLPLGLLTALAAPDDLASGWLGIGSMGMIAVLVTWFALDWLVRVTTWGGPVSDRYRDALENELVRNLGLLPTPLCQSDLLGAHHTHLAGEPRNELHPPRMLVRASLLLGFAAIGIVVTMAIVKRFAHPRTPPSPVLARGLPAILPVDLANLSTSTKTTLPRCICQRADSPLWHGGLPRLGLLWSTGPDSSLTPPTPVIEPNGRSHYDFDLAIVNNGKSPLRDVRIVLTFARRDHRRKRVVLVERGLFWEGMLVPGQAVKWHVEAPGTEIKVEPSVTDMLQGDEATASAEAFFQLTQARYRVVRTHAAMMLAYLRDKRAIEALDELAPPSMTERELFDQIRRAVSEVFVCSIQTQLDRLQLCLFNATVTSFSRVTLIEPGTTKRWPVDMTLPVHEGLELVLPSQGEPLPVELLVERPIQ